jgi:hypothetical protein
LHPPHPFVSQKKHQKIREKKGQKEERKKERNMVLMANRCGAMLPMHQGGDIFLQI